MNELIPRGDLLPNISAEEFKEAVSSSTYLPRIQIIDPKSKLSVKKIVPAGNYALVRGKEDADDLTSEFDAIVCGMRWKALDTNGETPLTVFDKSSQAFKEIEAKSAIKDSGCMWGPEFLLWVASMKKYATFFCSSKTSRREATNIYDLIASAATFKINLIETKQYTWYGPSVVPCSAPFEIPPVEEIKAEVARFNNPEISVTAAPEAERER